MNLNILDFFIFLGIHSMQYRFASIILLFNQLNQINQINQNKVKQSKAYKMRIKKLNIKKIYILTIKARKKSCKRCQIRRTQNIIFLSDICFVAKFIQAIVYLILVFNAFLVYKLFFTHQQKKQITNNVFFTLNTYKRLTDVCWTLFFLS